MKTITKSQAKRIENLMPNGIPRYIRIYFKPDTLDCYTVVFAKQKGYLYIAMSTMPFSPLGFCQHGEANEPIDKPTYKHLGKKIKFQDLPADCQTQVISDYVDLWGIEYDKYKHIF